MKPCWQHAPPHLAASDVGEHAMQSNAPAMASWASYRQLKKFQALDGLRALSILAVVWHHTAGPYMPGMASYVGTHGVTLFFAISGFLITSLLLREQDRNGKINFRDFYVRRALRIFPLYYAVLALYAVLVALFEGESAAGRLFWHNLPYFLTYTSNLFVPLDGRVIFYFAWSLAVEEQFYLVWPCLLKWLGNARRAACLLGLVLAGVGATVITGHMNANDLPLAIVGGALLAVLLHIERSHQAVAPVLRHPLFALLLLGATVGALSNPTLPALCVHALLVLWVGAAVLARPTAWVRALNSRPFVVVGTVSYGIYMLHMLAKNAAEKIIRHASELDSPYVLFGLTLCIALVMAKISYRYFEGHFISMKNKFQA